MTRSLRASRVRRTWKPTETPHEAAVPPTLEPPVSQQSRPPLRTLPVDLSAIAAAAAAIVSRTRAWRLLGVALVALLGALPLSAGCQQHEQEDTAADRAPVPLPVPSFGRKWATELDFRGKDEVTELHIREDLLFAYTKSGTAYVMKRDSGAIQHVDPVEGGAAKLR